MVKFSEQDQLAGTQIALRVLMEALSPTHPDALQGAKRAIQDYVATEGDQPCLQYAIGMFPAPQEAVPFRNQLLAAVVRAVAKSEAG
jgi:hypothetical protein